MLTIITAIFMKAVKICVQTTDAARSLIAFSVSHTQSRLFCFYVIFKCVFTSLRLTAGPGEGMGSSCATPPSTADPQRLRHLAAASVTTHRIFLFFFILPSIHCMGVFNNGSNGVIVHDCRSHFHHCTGGI